MVMRFQSPLVYLALKVINSVLIFLFVNNYIVNEQMNITSKLNMLSQSLSTSIVQCALIDLLWIYNTQIYEFSAEDGPSPTDRKSTDNTPFLFL